MYNPKTFKAPKMSPAEKFFADRGMKLIVYAPKFVNGKQVPSIRFHVEKDGLYVELNPKPMPDELPKDYIKRIGGVL